MNEFEVLTATRGWEATKVLSECEEINIVPSTIIPAMVSLNVIPMMVSVHVETDALVVLACDWSTVDEDGDLLVNAMIEGRRGAEAAVLTIPSGKKIGVDVEPSR
jgi:hypothetical protein